jgi:hypothetical protein
MFTQREPTFARKGLRVFRGSLLCERAENALDALADSAAHGL